MHTRRQHGLLVATISETNACRRGGAVEADTDPDSLRLGLLIWASWPDATVLLDMLGILGAVPRRRKVLDRG
jgi:hypothetical protein